MTTEKEIVLAFKEGSQKAFRIIYDTHYKLLIGVGFNLLKDEDNAKEVVQEVFYQFWKNRANFKTSVPVKNYLKRAVINRCITQLKYQARFTGDETLAHETGNSIAPDVLMENADLKKVIDLAMEKVPEKARIVFILKRHEGLSLKEIAEKLEISPKTVENQITRALKILKQEIAPYLKKINSD